MGRVRRVVIGVGENAAELADRLFLIGMGRRVRLLRHTREMSQEQLATAAGLSRNFVSSIERGAHGVDVLRLLHLAAALEVSLAAIVVEPQPAASRSRPT
jgi:transcriptional regulator with XRE-family HTH domain